jgi:hypothetical protein
MSMSITRSAHFLADGLTIDVAPRLGQQANDFAFAEWPRSDDQSVDESRRREPVDVAIDAVRRRYPRRCLSTKRRRAAYENCDQRCGTDH